MGVGWGGPDQRQKISNHSLDVKKKKREKKKKRNPEFSAVPYSVIFIMGSLVDVLHSACAFVVTL